MEPILENEILDASGHYDKESQTWVLDEKASDSSILMTGLNPERPPTTCSHMTKVGQGDYRSDSYVDD